MQHEKNKMRESTKIWNACGYVRLSHEDGDREESNSVIGQKDLIRDFFSHHPELVECGMRIDDGFSGSSFDRPAFQKMMADVRAGEIDCIVVKDLSRFGRNYLDAGEYIEQIFPFLGVRFIAINDNYDSQNRNEESDRLIIPFKNLINEAYCRDISVKIRSQLEMKRKRGDFIGAFAVYGYLKDPENKNHLIIDPYAADVVRDIFRWKLAGVSAGDIADNLNTSGILTPMDYKKSQGMRFATPFRMNVRSYWTATTVLRILKNPVYAGILVQGKNTTPSYKVKKRMVKSREEWDIVEGKHEAIIAPNDFKVVQGVLALDTRTSPGGGFVELFSGMVYCGECGASMVRKTVPSGKKKYVYYVCAAHKNEKTCFAHSMRDSVLEEVVLESLKNQIQNAVGTSRLLELIEDTTLQKAGICRLKERLKKKQVEIDKYQHLLYSLYENLSGGVIDNREYEKLKRNYHALCSEAEGQAGSIRMEIEQQVEICRERRGFLEQLKKSQGIKELDRTLVVLLIARILIYRDKRMEIVYNYNDGYQCLTEVFLHRDSSSTEDLSINGQSRKMRKER